MYYECPFFSSDRQPMQIVAPATIQSYIGRNITTFIPGYGRVRAYVINYNPATGMVDLLIFTPYGQQYTQVSSFDMVGIAPDFGGGFPGGAFPGGAFPGGAFPGGGQGGPGGGLGGPG